MNLVKEIGNDADMIRNDPHALANLQVSDIAGQLAVLLAQANNTGVGTSLTSPKSLSPNVSLESALDPASMMARSAVGWLTMVESTVNAQSSTVAAPSRPDTGRNRYKCRDDIR